MKPGRGLKEERKGRRVSLLSFLCAPQCVCQCVSFLMLLVVLLLVQTGAFSVGTFGSAKSNHVSNSGLLKSSPC